jgi:hypothetical protein
MLDPVDQVLCEQYGPIEAVIHSHPVRHNDPIWDRWPTLMDQEQQIKGAVPWGICVVINGHAQDPYFWGDNSLPVAEYLGRPFIHGVYDCYSLVRDYYRREFGILLNAYPREWEWWEKTPELDLYRRNMMAEGFFEISFKELRPGDCVLGTVLSNQIINHSGVYLGNSLLLHHLVGRVSRTDPIGRWQKLIRYYMRHEKRR